ncbi:sialidase [Thalassoglobus sp. JC818]|uniref:sialidase n=1 Tax=Thalassoglobus sp. JC818 TaxID=3232136 RepID=UPI00345ABDE2
MLKPQPAASPQNLTVLMILSVVTLMLVLAVCDSAEPKRDTLPKILAESSTPPPELKNDFGEYHSLLLDRNGDELSSLEKWQVRHSELRNEWTELLGAWPPLIERPQVEVLDATDRDEFNELKVRFLWTPKEHTTAYILVPPGEGPFPGVVTVYYEPETAIGQGKEYRDFAYQLTKRGFVTLSIGTTEATAQKTYSLYYPSIDNAEVQPLSMLGYAAANAYYVLATRPDVDAERIGIVGHSFGGKWAMFASCLFDQFACAAWSDPGIVFDDDRPNVNYWEPWYLGYEPLPWRKRGLVTPENPASGLYPKLREAGRDLHELHALMAPRPFLVSGGSEDPVERWKALNRSVQVNQLYTDEPRVFMHNRPDHSPNKDSNEVIYTFFEYFLKSSPAPETQD